MLIDKKIDIFPFFKKIQEKKKGLFSSKKNIKTFLLFLDYLLTKIDQFQSFLIIECVFKNLRSPVKIQKKFFSNFDFFHHAFEWLLIKSHEKKAKENFFWVYFQCKNLLRVPTLFSDFFLNNVGKKDSKNLIPVFPKLDLKTAVGRSNNLSIYSKFPFSASQKKELKKKKKQLLKKEINNIHNLISNKLVKLNSFLHSKVFEQVFFIEQTIDNSRQNYQKIISTKKNLVKEKKNLFIRLEKVIFLFLLIIFWIEFLN